MLDWIPFWPLFLCNRQRRGEEEVRPQKKECYVPHATLVPITVVPWEEFVKSAKEKDL